MIRTTTITAAILVLALPAAAQAQERYAAATTMDTAPAPAPASTAASATAEPVADTIYASYYTDAYVFETPSTMAYEVTEPDYPRSGTEKVLKADGAPKNLRPEDTTTGV